MQVQAQELTQSVGEEITRMIAQQKNLEQRFEELVSAQHVLRHLPNKSKLRENQVRVGGWVCWSADVHVLAHARVLGCMPTELQLEQANVEASACVG